MRFIMIKGVESINLLTFHCFCTVKLEILHNTDLDNTFLPTYRQYFYPKIWDI